MTNGWNTKEFREKHELEKDHDIDAYCIAASILKDVQPVMQTKPYEVKQFRRHNRARIHHQTERTYRYDGKIIAKNRKKRMDQKTDSLEDWVADMTKQYGQGTASRMLSKVTVQKSTRHYERPDNAGDRIYLPRETVCDDRTADRRRVLPRLWAGQEKLSSKSCKGCPKEQRTGICSVNSRQHKAALPFGVLYLHD